MQYICKKKCTLLSQEFQDKMKVTHMHILRSHILAGQRRSRSTCLCGGRRCPSRCTTLRSAVHSSCSSHSHPRRSWPREHSKACSDTYRATGRTVASQKQPAHLWKSAVHYSEHCRDPVFVCVCGEGGEYNTTHYTLYLLLTETCYSQSGLAHWKLHFKAFNGLNNPDVLKWHSKERKGKIYFWTVSYHFNY